MLSPPSAPASGVTYIRSSNVSVTSYEYRNSTTESVTVPAVEPSPPPPPPPPSPSVPPPRSPPPPQSPPPPLPLPPSTTWSPNAPGKFLTARVNLIDRLLIHCVAGIVQWFQLPKLFVLESGRKHSATRLVPILVSIPCALMVIALLLVFLWRRKGRSDDEEESPNLKPLSFDRHTLKVATNHFADSNKLGEGGFGPVYKGVLPDGQQVAVKRLSTRSHQGLAELRNEIQIIAQLQHKNLVRMLGYCWAQEKLLVYEYLPNTSLDKILFNDQRRGELNWERRYKIIQGIASGLAYLHDESRIKVIHRDLKPGNILLDQHMNPKISDFGLSKLHDADLSTACASRIVGTHGYIAPEYACNRYISTKSDVYSYGMLALVVITGRSINHFNESAHYSNLQSDAWKNWRKGEPLVIVDANLGQQYNKEEALRCIHIALLCIQADHSRRPSMSLVMHMLHNCSMTKPDPQAPAFHVVECEIGDNKPGEGAMLTVNEVTTSIMDPR